MAAKRSTDEGRKVVARNKFARSLYDIEESFEAGMALWGTEVKSLRAGSASLRDSFADVRHEEVFLENAHFAPYAFGNRANHDPLRSRKLLLHKREIKKLIGKVTQRGYTLVPLEIYFVNGKAKISIALGKGKRTIDRREDIKKREMQREMDRAMRLKR